MADAKSPSSRRAWIEIMTGEREAGTTPVALLAEGVDRNYNLYSVFLGHGVALLAEGVDRNQAVCYPLW